MSIRAIKGAEFYQRLPFNEQYAHWCAHGDLEEYGERYRIGLVDFDEFARLKGVAQVAINWHNMRFIIGTELIEWVQRDDVHLIGHLVMWLNLSPSSYGFENLTPNPAGHHHPYAPANSTVFCGISDGYQELVNGIVEGRPSRSWKLLLAAAFMEEGLVKIGGVNSGADTWPRKTREG